jgi:hypothetical protein
MPESAPWKFRTRTRYAAHSIWDVLTDPPVAGADDVPWRVEAITPDWLTAQLCGEHPGARVESVEVRGDNDLGSTVHRWLTVGYNEAGIAAGLPTALFAKSTPTVLTRLASGGHIVTQERTFYTVARDRLPIETPSMAACAIDRTSGRSVTLFDDLVVSKGTTFFSKDSVVERDVAEQIVDTLAGYHGAFWDSPLLETDLGSLARHGAFLAVGERIGMRAAHDEAMDKAKGVIPAAVYERRDEIWAHAVAAMEFHEGSRTLLHGDMHLGNWYRNADGRVGLADWQNTSIGNWVFDFAYAVSTTLDVEDRRAWERELLERYVAAVGHGLTTDVAWSMYRRALTIPLLLWTPTLVPSPVFPDMQTDEMSMLMIHRIATAMDDLGTLDQETTA